MSFKNQPSRLGLAIAIAAIIADQITKHMLLATLNDGGMVTVLPFFNLVLVWNQGISFGMLHIAPTIMPYLLSLLAITICLYLYRWLQDAHSRWLGSALGLIIGGALGNVVDRFLYGAVVDFLDFHLSGHHWPAFNVADSCICIGVFMLLLGGRHKNA